MGSFPLFTRQCLQAQIRLTGLTRTQLRDMRPELARTPSVATRLRHGIQARGGEPGILVRVCNKSEGIQPYPGHTL